jgi:hypothetical protein
MTHFSLAAHETRSIKTLQWSRGSAWVVYAAGWRGRKSEKDERLRNVGPENKKRGLVQAPFLN